MWCDDDDEEEEEDDDADADADADALWGAQSFADMLQPPDRLRSMALWVNRGVARLPVAAVSKHFQEYLNSAKHQHIKDVLYFGGSSIYFTSKILAPGVSKVGRKGTFAGIVQF